MGKYILLLLLQFLTCFRGSSRSGPLDFIAGDESATAFAFDGRRCHALEVGFQSWVSGKSGLICAQVLV